MTTTAHSLLLTFALSLATTASAGDTCRVPNVPTAKTYSAMATRLWRAGFTSHGEDRPYCIFSSAGHGCDFIWRTPSGEPFTVFAPLDGKAPFVADCIPTHRR